MFSRLFGDYKKAQKAATSKVAELVKKTAEPEVIMPDYKSVIESFFKTPQGIEFALKYDLLKLSEISAMRKDFAKENDAKLVDVVIQGNILLKGDGSFYRVITTGQTNFPLVATTQEFNKLTGGEYSAKVRMSRSVADSLFK